MATAGIYSRRPDSACVLKGAVSEPNGPGDRPHGFASRTHGAKNMSRYRESRSVAVASLAVVRFFIGVSQQALAHVAAAGIPEHAEARRYGNGWQCKPGYRESNDACAEIKVHENGYATNSPVRQGWECRHDLEEADGTCEPMRVPANAVLDPLAGDGWFIPLAQQFRGQFIYRAKPDVSTSFAGVSMTLRD